MVNISFTAIDIDDSYKGFADCIKTPAVVAINEKLSGAIIANGKAIGANTLAEQGDLSEREASRWTSGIMGAVGASLLVGIPWTGAYLGHASQDTAKLERLRKDMDLVNMFETRVEAGEHISPEAKKSLTLQKNVISRVQDYTSTSNKWKCVAAVTGIADLVLGIAAVPQLRSVMRCINAASYFALSPEACLSYISPKVFIASVGLVSLSLVTTGALLYGRYNSQPEARLHNREDGATLIGVRS